ncbi:MAG: DUF4390 domain-containing protein, partial [bacterium]
MADVGRSRSADRRSAGAAVAHFRLHDKDKRSQIAHCAFSNSSSIFCFAFAFVVFWLIVPPGLAQETSVVIDSLRMKENYLLVDFHADSLLTRHLLNGMQRGLTSSAQYRVQLWRKRGFLFGSTLLAERQYEIKSTYDPWEQKYVIITAAERRLTSALDLVRHWWEQHHGVALAELKDLHPSRRHFVTIDLQIEPVSKESLNEIRGWLAGEVKGAGKSDSTGAANATDEKRG